MIPALTDMQLVVVDDNLANVELIEQIMANAGYTNVLSTQEAAAVPHLCESAKPDLLLLDLHMPDLSGYEILEAIRDLIDEPENLPVLVLTADHTREARQRALEMGARDFVTKPLDAAELLLRVRNLLQTRQLQQRLESHNALLGERVRERTMELEQARRESLSVLASVAEYHDDDTHQHTRRVGLIAARIAQALELPEQFVADIREAAQLHDIGKIGISRQVLLKPAGLTPDERHNMMRHVEIGGRILASARSPVLHLAAEIARTHHEHWDGQGYMIGLSGEEIPLSGRITAIADVFDALIYVRPYKPAWELERALDEIAAQAGRQFDPRVAEAFVTLDHQTLDPQYVGGAAEARGAA